jgi:hypothetical protein
MASRRPSAELMEVAMEWKNERICDVLNLLLGAFLVASPWLFGFAAGAETQNAVICGIIIVALSLAAFAAFAEWEEWLNLIVGLWVFVSPWVLGFAGSNTRAMGIHLVVGAIVALVAAIEVWMLHRSPPRLTAGN